MTPSPGKHPFGSLARLLSLAVGTLWLSGCGHRQEGSNKDSSHLPAAPVQVQTVESKLLVTTEEVVGTVRARLHATLEAKLSGRIERMPVVLGESLRKGQLVARLDAPEVKARFDQAEASLEQAERDWKRTSALFEQQSVTRAEYDAAQARQRIAKGAAAEAAAMMGYVEILAPFDGRVTKKWADLGDLAVPGKPLVQIEDPSALQLEADLPEGIGSRIQREARLDVRVDSLGQGLIGVVSEIAPAADPLSRTFRVKLDLALTPGLMAGQFGRVEVPTGERESVLTPMTAVVQRGQLAIVFTVTAQRARLQLVKTGKRLGDQVEILSGLVAGDVVVTHGAAQLTDGQSVEVR